jgi:hypothetical protein
VEGAPESVFVPPPWPLQVTIRFLFEEYDLCRGIGGGGPGHQDGQKGQEDGEAIKICIQIGCNEPNFDRP